MLSKQPIVIEVTRGAIVESSHNVVASVVNEAGHPLHSWGNTQFVTFPRSAIKMLQAIPLVESGAAEHFQLDDRMIALACASHRGEKEHLAVLHEWAEKVKIPESMYVCAPHLPYNEASAHDFIRRNLKPTVFCNNCAGKHSGIITTCMHLHEDPHGYENPEHPAQKRLRKVLSEATKFDHAKAIHGIDGCGIPTYAMPLQNIAHGMATFIDSKLTGARKTAVDRIIKAVTTNPFFISGSGEFATAVIEKTQGRAIVKGGAEGVMAGFIPAKKVAFALKCSDGAGRATQLATVQLLVQLGGMTIDEAKALSQFSQPKVTNWKGDVVGQLRIAKPQ
ncbi:asparaginase [Bdellovibrio sp. NC01]|uniref:asparaginase n=1 Tax=Bdellovibrio sp. NC01 TaxID=2220073 RepID=UPI001159AB75|nr:asparaginase [Bdellovibrio sp. NC01]QDK38321.1 asparaginase [Bdellovibrio sp. NC01]